VKYRLVPFFNSSQKYIFPSKFDTDCWSNFSIRDFLGVLLSGFQTGATVFLGKVINFWQIVGIIKLFRLKN
jgi:hypothetical protein